MHANTNGEILVMRITNDPFDTREKYSVLQSSVAIAISWVHSIVKKISSRDLRIEKLLRCKSF